MKTSNIIYIIVLMSVFSSCLPDEDLVPETDDPRDNIVDTWKCDENSPYYGESSYWVDISKDPNDSTRVIISNFYNLGTWSTTYASLSGMKLTVTNQSVEGHSISGEGNISSNYNTINWTYEVIELNKSEDGYKARETVTAVYTR
jgi:hypothetical protein